MNNRQLPMGRRKFIISGVLTSLSILILPVLKLFGRSDFSRACCPREPDELLEIASKYGAEFGGDENVCI